MTSLPRCTLDDFDRGGFDDMGIVIVKDPEYGRKVTDFFKKYPDARRYYKFFGRIFRFLRGEDTNDYVGLFNLVRSEKTGNIMGMSQHSKTDGIKLSLYLSKYYPNLIANKELFADLLELALMGRSRLHQALCLMGEEEEKEEDIDTLLRLVYSQPGGRTMAWHMDVSRLAISTHNGSGLNVFANNQVVPVHVRPDELVYKEGFLRRQVNPQRLPGLPHMVEGAEAERIALILYDFAPNLVKALGHVQRVRKALKERGFQ